jgi:glycosyltransferase involved in cell wall biosynthesis
MTQRQLQWPADTFVLVPAYKAAAALNLLLPQLLKAVPAPNVCVADDGSRDGTQDVCRRFAVEYVSNPVNKGKGAVLAKGFSHLIGDKGASWVITMDADGQHAVADLPVFQQAIRQAPDAGLIVGRRTMRPGAMPLSRICSNMLTSAFLSQLTGRRILDSQCGFRAYSGRLLAAAPCRFERFEMESEIIMRACRLGFSVNFVNVQTLYFSTQSHISHVADTLRWLRAVITIFLELRRTTP